MPGYGETYVEVDASAVNGGIMTMALPEQLPDEGWESKLGQYGDMMKPVGDNRTWWYWYRENNLKWSIWYDKCRI